MGFASHDASTLGLLSNSSQRHDRFECIGVSGLYVTHTWVHVVCFVSFAKSVDETRFVAAKQPFNRANAHQIVFNEAFHCFDGSCHRLFRSRKFRGHGVRNRGGNSLWHNVSGVCDV